MNRTQVYGGVVFFLFILAFLYSGSPWGCGGTTRGATALNNELANAYPSELAVSSPTASSSSSSSLSTLGFKLQTTFTPETFAGKKEDLENLVNFEDADTFRAEIVEMANEVNFFKDPPNVKCYGPTLTYQNHPNSPTDKRDADGVDNGPNDDDGELPQGDLGIWIATEVASGEACCSAQMNSIVSEFEALVNAGTKTVAAVLGAASFSDTLDQLPAAGQMLDMTSQANTTFDQNSVTSIDFDTATLERETKDTTEGSDPIFVTETNTTFTFGDDQATMEAILTHIPMGEEEDSSSLKGQSEAISNETYCGTLTQSVNIPAEDLPALGNCSGSDGVTRCTSIDYCKTSSTSITYHVRTAEFCGQNKDCGTVDPSDKKTTANPTGWGNNFFYTTCELNPENGTGRCAQSWQAGPQDGNTRVLNVVVSSDDTGRCYFGFGPDVAASSGVGSISGMICNWAGPGSEAMGQKSTTLRSLAQRQEFSKNASGLYVPTSSNITFAPTNDCNKAAGTFSYEVKGDSSTLVSGATAVTNNLIPLADVSFTVPSLPAVPE